MVLRFVPAALAMVMAVLPGCTNEARTLGAELPVTPPRSADDPRIAFVQQNVDQVSRGGRYFGWYGCSGCHRLDAHGALDLADGRWRHGGAFDQVYRSIAGGSGDHAYAGRIPVQQLWQITAYVRDMPAEQREKLVRQAIDQAGEPTGNVWSGAVR